MRVDAEGEQASQGGAWLPLRVRGENAENTQQLLIARCGESQGASANPSQVPVEQVGVEVGEGCAGHRVTVNGRLGSVAQQLGDLVVAEQPITIAAPDE